MNKRKNKSYWI